jgi:glycosyltransferase involved in cell wall biosynthesis
MGIEDFSHPATRSITTLPAEIPDILHLHNLHRKFFDLTLLPYFSTQLPTLITLHDTWLLTGHCGYFLDCDRWKSGCGNCPYLHVAPAIRRDATAYNWTRKRNIYQQSKLFIVTPSHWLLEQAEESILRLAIIKSRVIPNGVDLSIFKPGNKHKARQVLGLPQDHHIILFVGSRAKTNYYKNLPLIEEMIQILANRSPNQKTLFINLGEETSKEYIKKEIPMSQSETRYYRYQTDLNTLADFYRAADVYVHAARAENFPTVILEAMACGTPVVATDVGGIGEQVRHGETGFLTDQKDPNEMAIAVEELITKKDLRNDFGKMAYNLAKQKFSQELMVRQYVEFYTEAQQIWQAQIKSNLRN